ncbi:MAG TPA: polymer-forming cytoskeletal protein [Candidatus Limnocylindrales bacterium]|nr:polymer-forming cytoskeletal protein [Candidatus Limnocylindrales bacterium]
MWNKSQSETPAPSQWQPAQQPAPSAGVRSSTSSSPVSRNLSCLGASIEIKGKISGDEDLQIDGKVEGAVALNGQRLTVGRSGQLHSEIFARDVVVYGNVTGNVHASDRVEIKKDGSVTGDITTARISVEDGAYFKGRIEIERKQHSTVEAEPALVGAAN